MKTPLSQLIDLTGKTALVTGGAMGIGFGIAYRLAEAGANVVIADINEEVGAASVAQLQEHGFKATFIKTDVALAGDVQRATDFVVQTYGGIDILVNNAGIYPFFPVMEMSPSDFEKILAVNLKSVFLFTKAAGAEMIKRGRGGKIINITSIDALHPSFAGLAVYDASKHGLWGFTKNFALEVAKQNIRCNAIAPGGISTEGVEAMTKGAIKAGATMDESIKAFTAKIPMGRFGEPDDIATVALFLASDAAAYMTGEIVVVDGGVLLA